jgi:hypothetical protein
MIKKASGVFIIFSVFFTISAVEAYRSSWLIVGITWLSVIAIVVLVVFATSLIFND